MPNRSDKLVTAGALLLFGSTAAMAGRGDIDSAFGVDGRVRAIDTVVSTPDDHFISCGPADGGFFVRRFDRDGHLDATFGRGGEIVVALPAGATPSMGECQLVAARGGLLFAGYLRDAGLNRIDEVVLRVDGNGRLDAAFGGHGDGIYRLTDTPLQADGWFTLTMAAITVDTSGRIVYADRHYCGHRASVVRLTSNGARDTTFGVNGRAELPGVIDLCSTAVLLGARADGSVVVATRGFMAGLDAHGAPDAEFGVSGLVTEGVPDSDGWLGRLDPDGSIQIIGNRRDSTSADSELRQFDRHGQLDSSFGGGTGVVSLALGTAFTGDAGAHVSAGNFVVEPGGSHMYVQLTVVRGDGTLACRSGIARLAVDGTPDVTFGTQGLTCLDYGAFPFWLASVQRNGAPLFIAQYDLNGTSLYRLLVDATPSRGMLTLVLAEPWIRVGESVGQATVTIARVAGRDGAVGAHYSTGYPPFDDLLDPEGPGDGTRLAIAGTDYQATSGELDWADGDDSRRTVNVPILNDDIHENRDIFGILISEPRGGVLVNGGSTNLEIDDDDPSAGNAPPPADPPPTNPPPPVGRGDGGGGGSVSWMTLLGLLGLLRARHARAAGSTMHPALRKRDAPSPTRNLAAAHRDVPANSCPRSPVSCLPAPLRRNAQRRCDADLTLAITTAARRDRRSAMYSNGTSQSGAVLSALIAMAVGSGSALAADFPPAPSTAAGVSVAVVASGLHDPRGLAIGPGNQIYVAEAGTTVGIFVPPPPPPHNEPPTRTRCEMYWPVGPKVGGYSGGVSRIGADGGVHVVTDALPSSAANLLIGGDRFGAAGIGFRGQRLYVMVNGGGCAEGHPSEPNGLYQVFSDGSFVPRIDLSAYLRSHEDSKSPLDEDFEPDGTWYNLVRAFGAFYATEPNHGVLLRLDDDGSASLLVDLLGTVATLEGDGDQTWTALVRHGDAFYLGTLGRIDLDFDAAIYRVNRDGSQFRRVASGLHGVVGIAFDRSDRMYALETTASGVNPPLSDPTVGRLVRVERDGSLTPLVTGLAFPTALMAGRDGAFYVLNCGYHCDDPATGESLGVGQVLRVSVEGAEAESLQ